ncbi:DEAD/DEAH box helicase [Leminorella grimontii]|uniref:DEAD/DEAH box helicase n=1 Tax=Leminorella grimontii TaxID=82981 RepID=UPI0020810204|nr:DEAD/DEAH box helicase [Leminorella grimontii]GKX59604.1 ATP-binding protein [Leminorella grimontii]
MDDKHHDDDPTARALKILDYWHKIEFFESTDIKSLEDDADGVLRLTLEDLQYPESLPWVEPQRIRLAGKGYLPTEQYNYELFFGIFDRREIFDRAKQMWPELTDVKEELLQDEGRTCSIKCRVDYSGRIDNCSFEFSTVTWALGQLESRRLDDICLDAYDAATEELRQRFLQILEAADNLKQENSWPLFLTTAEIVEFLKAMAEWTHFSPEIPAPALYIKLKKVKEEKSSSPVEPAVFPDRLPEFHRFVSMLPERLAPPVALSSSRRPSNDIPILNSFYLRDIERAIKWIRENGIVSDSSLGRYLIGDRAQKSDLLTPDGRSLLLDKLKLSQLPTGRWPSDAGHNMSLMQQFAINTMEEELAESGLYSVNGPPGTGKTTMLRDLIAGNLVKRAAELVRLNQASDAFIGAYTLTHNGQSHAIPILSPQLCGFEMVVVSSNNAAVENISRELPQQRSLGKAWHDIGYLKPTAQKLAADDCELSKREQKEGKLFKIEPLTEQNDCWGLVAVALGKQGNRDIFGQRVFFRKSKYCLAPKPADLYRNLYEAVNQLPKDAFSDAKTAFIDARERVDVILAELQRLEALPFQDEACRRQKAKMDKHYTRLLKLNSRLTKRQMRKWRWWPLKFGLWFRERAIVDGLKHRLAAEKASHQLEAHRYESLRADLQAERDRCALLAQKYPDAFFASEDTNIESAAVQRTSFGHCQALNKARSELTIKALDLHQAWLGAAYKENRLHEPFRLLMRAINGSISDRQISLALWRLLFMIVPVVSSTFASVARQFIAFGEGDIGWLFVDEAGQATPQQAVGALWRAKRAVVVGDPLQIEPVFTIPPEFVETIARRAFGDAWKNWSPSVQSVQNLADRVNPYGTGQITNSTWLGSPLRVHRRCDEPMFSIANAIAYNNKMLHGRDDIKPQDVSLWGNSCWFDVRGKAEGKHFVPEQARHVLSMLRVWLEAHSTLPDAYIISPFKQVKERLKQVLKDELRDVSGSGEWIKERVGTVHTFQGKEEKNVIIVLGLSDETRGAAKWASSKPNLLNVAVTRAQKRVYIIGSKEIWSGCEYFNVANEKLETRNDCPFPDNALSI